LFGKANTGFEKSFSNVISVKRLRNVGANRYADRPFSCGSDIGKYPFWAGYKHYKKSKTGLYIIKTLLKKYAD
jgi:hypothetical protein